jgi:hypothetical protein
MDAESHGFDFDGCSMFIRTTDHNDIITLHSAISGVEVCEQEVHYVAQVGCDVKVWPCRCHQDFPDFYGTSDFDQMKQRV